MERDEIKSDQSPGDRLRGQLIARGWLMDLSRSLATPSENWGLGADMIDGDLAETYARVAWRKSQAERNGMKPLSDYDEALAALATNKDVAVMLGSLRRIQSSGGETLQRFGCSLEWFTLGTPMLRGVARHPKGGVAALDFMHTGQGSLEFSVGHWLDDHRALVHRRWWSTLHNGEIADGAVETLLEEGRTGLLAERSLDDYTVSEVGKLDDEGVARDREYWNQFSILH